MLEWDRQTETKLEHFVMPGSRKCSKHTGFVKDQAVKDQCGRLPKTKLSVNSNNSKGSMDCESNVK